MSARWQKIKASSSESLLRGCCLSLQAWQRRDSSSESSLSSTMSSSRSSNSTSTVNFKKNISNSNVSFDNKAVKGKREISEVDERKEKGVRVASGVHRFRPRASSKERHSAPVLPRVSPSPRLLSTSGYTSVVVLAARFSVLHPLEAFLVILYSILLLQTGMRQFCLMATLLALASAASDRSWVTDEGVEIEIIKKIPGSSSFFHSDPKMQTRSARSRVTGATPSSSSSSSRTRVARSSAPTSTRSRSCFDSFRL